MIALMTKFAALLMYIWEGEFTLRLLFADRSEFCKVYRMHVLQILAQLRVEVFSVARISMGCCWSLISGKTATVHAVLLALYRSLPDEL